MTDKAKVTIIAPESLPQAKVGKIAWTNLDTVVADAEAALADLNDEYDVWIREDLARLAGWIAEAKAKPADAPALLKKIYGVGHDIKGQAMTFNYPLLSDIAGTLCNLITRNETPSADRLKLVALHLEAMKIVVNQQVRGSGGAKGRTLVAMLAAAVRKTIAG